MTIYTVVVGDRPVAAIQSASLGEAEEFLLGDAFATDLTTYEMKGGEPGMPIWDGEVEIFVRESFPEEIAIWERIRAKAVLEGDTNPDDENFVTFLRGVREIE
jgi:hypothetical protein